MQTKIALIAVSFLIAVTTATAKENWLQFKYDCRHSGNVPDRSVTTPLGLIGAVPLTDAVFTAPVVADGRVFVVDGAGVAFCIDAATLRVVWKFETPGGKGNCNNVSSPAIAGRYLHFGTMAGSYYILDASNGTVVKEITCGEPIFSAPIVANDRVYFATLGSQVYALEPDGTSCWIWDFVKEIMGFTGNRWSGEDWSKHRKGRVTIRDQFCCSRNLAMYGKMLVVPAGGSVVWLQDLGNSTNVRALQAPRNTTLGLSIGETGTVYRQWTLLDNGGSVDILRLRDGKVESDFVHGTRTNMRGGLLSFCSVSLRGQDVYRCRPEEGFGFCRHSSAQETQYLGGYPSIAPPILLRDAAVYGGLDGSLYVIPLSGSDKVWSFKTAFSKAISAPAAVCDGRIYFGCEDGYLYILGAKGKKPLPSRDLQLWKIRSPLTSKLTNPKYDRFTSFGNWANTNMDNQGIRPPFKINWIRRYEGTGKHFSTFGGGRMYTHTAEGQIFAVEQETGRLLWRKYFPGVHISYTSPLYAKGRLLVPQAGLEKCRLRCLDAATGKLLWEAPFAGSPSWNRQLPPIVHKNLAIYMFGTGRYGKYAPEGTGEKRIDWLFEHQDNPNFPQSHKPLLRAYDMETGEEVWTRDFSEFGSGGDDAGLCLMDETLYYSCYFGYAAKTKRDLPSAKGLTAAIDPATGRVIWLTTRYFIHGGCTISGKVGRLYLGGYNKLEAGQSLVWCVDARNGSLIWKSDPVREAIHVVTIGTRFLFVHAQYKNGFLIDKDTGKILMTLTKGYKCTRFTLSEPYLLGSNMDIHDLSDVDDIELMSSGPRLDPSECIGTVVSNGRIFYTCHGGGMQVSQVCGVEANLFAAPWQTTSSSAVAP
jgi:outer membrane protein assembly factor BamB